MSNMDGTTEHSNDKHSENYAKDGDAQPPEDHGNASHTTNYASDNHDNNQHSTNYSPAGHDNAYHSETYLTSSDVNEYSHNVAASGTVNVSGSYAGVQLGDGGGWELAGTETVTVYSHSSGEQPTALFATAEGNSDYSFEAVKR